MLGHASAAIRLEAFADLLDDDSHAAASRLNDAMTRVALAAGPRTHYSRLQ